MAEGLHSQENFCNTPVKTLHCYQQHHDNRLAHDLNTGCWTTVTPKAALTIFQKQVNNIV